MLCVRFDCIIRLRRYIVVNTNVDRTFYSECGRKSR